MNPCPVCGAAMKPFQDRFGYTHYRCTQCGYRRMGDDWE